MANVSGSTYPVVVGQRSSSLVNLGGLTGKPVSWSPSSQSKEDPSARSGAVLAMMPDWAPINLNIAGTDGIRRNAETVIPRENREDDDAYNRTNLSRSTPPFRAAFGFSSGWHDSAQRCSPRRWRYRVLG